MSMLRRVFIFTMAVSFVFTFARNSAHAGSKTPRAGILIGNQFSATYKDALGTSYTAVSNVVKTRVRQVASLSLEDSSSKNISPGNTIYFPHTLTNTGNGSDAFTLSVANVTGDDFDLSLLSIYPDENGDGLPDNQIAITTTGPLPPDGIFRVVVMGVVPSTTATAKAGKIKVSATSTFASAQTDSNEDTAVTSGQAIISVTERISSHSVSTPSGPHTFTLTYTNTGNTAATDLKLIAIIPADMTYVQGGGLWSVLGNTPLTDNTGDAQGTDPQTIDYSVSGATITAVVKTVLPGQSGTLTFPVNINSKLPAKTINHASTFSYHDGADPVAAGPTNTVTVTINQKAGVTTGSPAPITSANQGSTVSFDNFVLNAGNGPDSIDITIGTSTFPTGTTFQLYKADSATPLIDTNGNGIPDSGLLAAGDQVGFVLKAILPPGVSGDGPYTVNFIGTSRFDPTQKAQSPDILNTIVANTVDLTNIAIAGQTGATGAGAGPEATSQTTQTTEPGKTVRFSLFVKNTGSVTDTYDLVASTDKTFNTATLPTGWTVVFKDGHGAVVTNSGSIAAGENVNLFAEVSVPPHFKSGTTDIFFRALSPTSNTGDRLHDAVVVSPVQEITLSSNQSGQVFPGGVVVYPATLSNMGNGRETGITLTAADNQPGWAAVLYEDTNGNGVLDSNDAVITGPLSLGPIGASDATKLIFIKVSAPSGAVPGTPNNTTLSATGTGVAATITAASIVIAGKIVLELKHAPDVKCDGTPDADYTLSILDPDMAPGECILYKGTATNIGSADAIDAVISAATPEHTRYKADPPASVSMGTITSEPVDGAIGSIKATVPKLAPAESVIITFGVKINS